MTPTSPPEPPPHEPRQGSTREAQLATAARLRIHAGDKVPTFLLRGQAWLQRWISAESRIFLSLVVVVLAVVAAIIVSSAQILRVFFDGLDVIALVAIFLVNWLGNGGALVPIPGARLIGILLIFQQAVLLPSWEVFAVAGAAMSLGLFSYYLAGARTSESYALGDESGAEDLARSTGMLGDDTEDFSPGAELDAEAVSAITGVGPTDSDEESSDPDSRTGRLRQRFTSSLQRAQARAQPVIERRGVPGMFLLCFAPTPMGTAAAYVGGLMRFGFSRYLLASFAAKFLLAGIVVVLALTFSDAARAVDVPELHIPVINVTLFDDGVPDLPAASPSPSVAPQD